jgi:hypothetical protein
VALAEEGLTAMFPQRFDVPLPVPLPRCTFTQGEDDACQTHADARVPEGLDPFSQFRHRVDFFFACQPTTLFKQA